MRQIDVLTVEPHYGHLEQERAIGLTSIGIIAARGKMRVCVRKGLRVEPRWIFQINRKKKNEKILFFPFLD